MPNWAFRGMAVALRLMERFKRPKERLVQASLKPGQTVLEYGCGAGSFTVPAAQIVGQDGIVYALDIQPLALETVQRRIGREGLSNVETILSDRETGLADESVDVVLLYDTLHLVRDKQGLLEELHRVLRASGFLSADHQHTDREEFVMTMTSGNRFKLQAENQHTLSFRKV